MNELQVFSLAQLLNSVLPRSIFISQLASSASSCLPGSAVVTKSCPNAAIRGVLLALLAPGKH